MIRVVFNIFKSFFSLFFRPLKRLWCRRLKASEMDPGLPTVVTHSVNMDLPLSTLCQDVEEVDMEMESWDAWDISQSGPSAQVQSNQSNSEYYQHASWSSGAATKAQFANQNVRGRKPEPEPEPEPDYFQDMIPRVKRPAKIVVKKKDNGSVNTSAISSRLSVMDVAPPVGTELESWEEPAANEWGEEVDEDLSWEAEEALREKRRLERQTRSQEQQRRKQERDASRGVTKKKEEGGRGHHHHSSQHPHGHHSHHLAVKIS